MRLAIFIVPSVLVSCGVNALSMCSVVLPLVKILFFPDILPKPLTLHSSILKIAYELILGESEQAESMRPIISKIAVEGRVIEKKAYPYPFYD